MKKMINLFLFVFIVVNINCFATLRKTECNGQWSNPKIWQFGIIPSANDSILINHFVIRDSILSTQNNIITISENGELCGQYAFIINTGSRVYNYGSICAQSFELHDTLINYGIIKTTFFVISGYLKNLGYIAIGSYSCFGQASCTPIIYQQGNILVSNTEAFEYDWNNGIQSLNIDSIAILPTQTGYYKLRIKKTDTDNYSSFSDSVYVFITSSPENIKSQENYQIEITNDLFKVEIKNPSFKMYSIVIYNLLGIKISNNEFTLTHSVYFNKYSRGYYVYRITDGINIKSGTFIVK